MAKSQGPVVMDKLSSSGIPSPMPKHLAKGIKTTTHPHCVQVFPNQMVPMLWRSPLEECDFILYVCTLWPSISQVSKR